ncbi:hypothetical protein J7444_06800 [Labrenzia sp. R4_1]|nr:hypothetical protein [Labrenzia sp. R4_1]MBO9424420.1 hypothetical protein [Labrenzia sp. R4_1]
MTRYPPQQRGTVGETSSPPVHPGSLTVILQGVPAGIRPGYDQAAVS